LRTSREQVAEVVELPTSTREPLVSVVVPTYNHRAYLLEALDAIAGQRFGPFEAVVVDDGSTDGSFRAAAERAAELGLAGRIIRLSGNCGRSVARNAGVAVARAPLIAFTDGDCLPEPGWLAAGVGVLADSSHAIAQGPTRPAPHRPRPFFSHFI